MKINHSLICIFFIIILLFITIMLFPQNVLATDQDTNDNISKIGDLNDNGNLDHGDILLMLRHMSAISEDTDSEWILTEEKIKQADVNKNNQIDIGDVLIVLRYIAATSDENTAKKYPDWLNLEQEEQKKSVKVKSIKLSKTLKLKVGNKKTLKAEVLPTNATNKKVTWSSSNSNVVMVKNGVITAKKKGTATITATAKDGSRIKATCKITVTQPVTKITLKKSKSTIAKGKKEKLEVTVSPNNADNKNIIWNSSNPEVATVKDGVVTAKKKGTATITATAKDESKVKATCKITVTQLVTKITLKKSKSTIVKGKKEKLKLTVFPNNADNKNIIWSSSNPEVATVKDGVVTAKKKGTATITATAKDGSKVKATCKITVIQPVTEIILKNKITIKEGETVKLNAKVLPDNANNKTIIWSSSNPEVATVRDGLVTAKKKGMTTITVTSKDGSGKKGICNVIVNEIETTGIDILQVDKIVAVGTDLQLKAKILPANATNKKIMWSTSDPTIATIDQTGKVYGIKKGQVTITATTYNGKKDTCKIRVNIPARSISLNKTTLEMVKGNTENLTVIFNPIDTSSKEIEWISSNPNVVSVGSNKTASGSVTITAREKGTATITAISKNYGLAKTCNVTVIENSKLIDSLKYAYKFTTQAGGHITYAYVSNGDHRNAGRLEKGYSDCSHFVYRVFEHTGIMAKFVKSYAWGYHGCPNTTDVAHFKKGEKWNYSKASPGDVIWEHYGSGRSNHVYIYIGNGKKISCSAGHATGKAVNVGKVYKANSSTIKYERKIIHFNEFPIAPNSYFDLKTQTIKYK